MVVHGLRADEQPRGDLQVGEAGDRQRRDLEFLGRKAAAGAGRGLPGRPPGRSQLEPRPFGKAIGADFPERALRGVQVLARITLAPFPAQPFSVQELDASQVHLAPGLLQVADCLLVG